MIRNALERGIVNQPI